MSTLEKLIAQLCPDGVEYKPLGEMCDIGTGSSNRNEASTEGKYPFFVRSRQVERMDTYEFDEEAIIIPGEGGIGEIFHYIKGKYALHQRVYRIHFHDNTIDVRFAYYYLVAHFRMFILGKAVVATVSSIRKPMIEKFQLPIPPLPVQKEIVRMLDDMAGLIDALEEELAAHKKQYEYYRESLVSCDNNVHNEPRIPIGECIQRIENVKWNGNDKTYQYIELSSIDNDTHRVGETVTIDDRTAPSRAQQIIQKDDVLFGTTRPLLRRYCMIPEVLDGQICSTGFCVLRANPDKVLPSWLYYVISTNSFIRQVGRLQRGGGYPAISNSDLCSCKIPLPSIAEQMQSVKALACLDKLCNSMTEGLPGEIALRKQQYEYYRDKLLAFKRAG